MVNKREHREKNIIEFSRQKHIRCVDSTDPAPYILPIACPHCGQDIGYINTETGEHIIDGNYCNRCGHRLR